jgi:hypothetical protein
MKLRDTVGRGAILALGIGYGAGMMYLLDPDLGRHRRAFIRDQVVRIRNDARWWFERQLRNAVNNFRGSMAEARARVTEGPIADDRLTDRVRAQLGHATAQPGLLDIIVRDGNVIIRGPVRVGERQRIESRLARTRGVRACTLELEELAPGFGDEFRTRRTQQRIG